MSLLPLLAVSLFCWLSCATAVRAAEPSPPPRAIWSGLVLATNDPHPAQAPDRLRQFAQKLKNIFGYNQFQLVGEYSEKIGDTTERWLIPGKDFSLSVKTRNEPGERNPTSIVLYQNRRRLAEIETHLNPDSPLFIRGPQYAGGQLVIVVNSTSEVPPASPGIPIQPFYPANPALASKEPPPKEKPIPASVVAVPKEPFYPSPAEQHFGPAPADHPVPADRLGPLPADRLGPMPGDRPVDADPRLNRP